MTRLIVPDGNAPMVDPATSRPTPEWYRALQAIIRQFASIDSATGGLAGALADIQAQIAAWDDSVTIEFPDDKTYPLIGKAPYEITITETTTKSDSGTCTATFAIDGVPLGGTANSVSSSEQSQAHSSDNVLPAGGTLSVVISANSSCEMAVMDFVGTRVVPP